MEHFCHRKYFCRRLMRLWRWIWTTLVAKYFKYRLQINPHFGWLNPVFARRISVLFRNRGIFFTISVFVVIFCRRFFVGINLKSCERKGFISEVWRRGSHNVACEIIKRIKLLIISIISNNKWVILSNFWHFVDQYNFDDRRIKSH